MPKRDDVIREAKTWIDVPYKHAGRNRMGVDCIGPIILVAHALGLSTFDTTQYPKRPNPRDFITHMGQHMERIQVKQARHGDIIIFAEPTHPCHVGFLEMTDRGPYIIHSYAVARKVVRDALTSERMDRARLAYRYKGLDD